MKNRILLAASFLIPLVLAVGVCIKHEVFPFGENCILHIDMFHQYCPFFTEMMDKLKSGGSPFYSWRIGLGADFWGLYAYYLASPLNWLLLICPADYVIEFMTILVLLKIALCGLTFSYYLKEHFRSSNYAVCVFGTAYALSAFMAAYSWNIMWTDCMVLAPLIVLGLERLVKEGKARLYYVTLAVSILSNYYISILICIFLVIWFFITWFEEKKGDWMAWIRFAVYSLLAGGTGAILIIPEAIILGSSGSQDISFPDTVEWYFNLIEEMTRHAILTAPYTSRDHWPNIYCGVFVLVLFLLYLFNRKIDWKKRLVRGLFVLFFLLSFSNNMLDFIWHGFHFPDSLPGRQTFLYSFLLLMISYEAFLHLKENKIWHVVAAGVINAVFWYEAYQMADLELVTEQSFQMTALLLGGYLLLLIIFYLGRQKLQMLMLQLGGLMVLAELTINFNATGLDTTYRPAYVEKQGYYRSLLDFAETRNEEEGGGFYRVEEIERKTKNDSALYGFNSATQFSSLMNLDVSHFYQNIGMEGGKNYYCINGATPLFSAMLSVKYILADSVLEENPMRSFVAYLHDGFLFENEYCLPLGFMMDEEVIDAWNPQDAGKIEAQNQLAYLLGANEDMLTQIPSVSNEGETVIQVEEDSYLFATYDSTSISKLTEDTSDGRTREFSNVSHNYTLDLGYCTAGSTVWVRNTSNELLNLTVYKLNVSALDAAYQTLSAQTMEMTDFSDTRVEGTINVTKAGRLIFSIANDDGWSLYVDGEEVEPEAFGEAFISVYLDEGEHDIRLKYRTPGLGIGVFLTVLCIALFVLLQILPVKFGIDLEEKIAVYLPQPKQKAAKKKGTKKKGGRNAGRSPKNSPKRNQTRNEPNSSSPKANQAGNEPNSSNPSNSKKKNAGSSKGKKKKQKKRK